MGNKNFLILNGGRKDIEKNFFQSGESQIKKVYLLLKDKINVGLEK